MAELKRTFRPEFLNRIDETIIFHPLNAQDIAEIARKLLAVTARRVEGLGISMEVDDAAVELVAKEGFDPVYGARPLRRAIQSNVEDAVAEALLQGEVKEGDHICATAGTAGIAIIRKAEAAAESSDAPTENSNAWSVKQYLPRQPLWSRREQLIPAVFSFSPAPLCQGRHKNAADACNFARFPVLLQDNEGKNRWIQKARNNSEN